jgi:L-rhamnose mutarotase
VIEENGMRQRVGFALRVKPDKIEEYVRAHGEVWPEMLVALKGAGVRNYTIFRSGADVFGYFETDDADNTEAYLAGQEVCARWQDAMADLLEQRVPDKGPDRLDEIFRLS